LCGNGGALGRALTDPGFQLAWFNTCTWFQLHVADRQLAGIGIRLTDHGCQADGGVLKHDILDRAGIDVVAAANNEILRAAGYPEVAILVETA
jgi:hypothetical protein